MSDIWGAIDKLREDLGRAEERIAKLEGILDVDAPEVTA